MIHSPPLSSYSLQEIPCVCPAPNRSSTVCTTKLNFQTEQHIVQGKSCQKSPGFQTISSSETQRKFRASQFPIMVKTIILKTVIYCTIISILTLKNIRKTNPEYAENCGNSFCASFIIMDNMAKTQHKSTCFCRVRKGKKKA